MEISQYLSVFMDECREHLQTLNQSLLDLEHNPDDHTILDRIFRAAHTLKGASATMGFVKMANLTHNLEDVLSKLRSKELKVSTDIINVLFDTIDLLETLAQNIGSGQEGDVDVADVLQELKQYADGDSKADEEIKKTGIALEYTDSEIADVEKALTDDPEKKIYHIQVTLADDCVLKGARVYMILRETERLGVVFKGVPSIPDLEAENFDLKFVIVLLSKATAEDIHRGVYNINEVSDVFIDQKKFEEIKALQKDAVVTTETPVAEPPKAEESPQPEIQPSSVSVEEKPDKVEKAPTKAMPEAVERVTNKVVNTSSGSQTVRVDIHKLDELMNLVGELVINRSRLESISTGLNSRELEEIVEQVGRLTLDLRDSVLKARMIPIEAIFSRFPRLVRDLSKELGKEINLEIFGGETELDRTVIDEIGEPMLHIIRNAIDHGVESVEERLKANKPKNGRIVIRAFQEGSNVIISVTDDGRGFNIERVKEKAVQKGLVNKEALEGMNDEQILAFTLMPGFSTAEKITDISGRGVGMDVVKTKVDELGGVITISSKYGEGSSITVKLPLTMMIIQTLLIQLGEEIYAIPSNYIQQIISIDRKEVKMIRTQEVFELHGELTPLIRLQELLDTPNAINTEIDEVDIVILKIGEQIIGCAVDKILPQRDVVIKSLGGYLGSIKGVAGATILGDGRVALILDIRSVA